MYENQTENIILNRMLEKVPNDIDKREGSIIYDANV
nr:MAG TPA: Baseplate J like protein [Caudoviricetes sp.]